MTTNLNELTIFEFRLSVGTVVVTSSYYSGELAIATSGIIL